MTVQVRDGKMSATNEPFKETKEVLGAFIEARHLNEAGRIGAGINKLIGFRESRESNSGARLPSDNAAHDAIQCSVPPRRRAQDLPPNFFDDRFGPAILNNPDVKAIGYPGGQMLGNVPTFMQAAGKKPGEIFNFGFDTSPQIVEGFKGGWVQLTADQQPFLQGYLPILSLCQQVVYGLAPINVDTGAGFVTPENYEIVAKLATEALR